MKIEFHLNEIRAAMATLSAVHAGGEMTRADVTACVNFVEARCDEIAAAAQPAPQPTPATNGTVQLPILKLHDVAAEMRAQDAAHAVVKSGLKLVQTDGDAA